MLAYAGIDEAGYGPLMGPLCVASTLWHVPHADPEDPDLWTKLRSCVCRRPGDRKRRIAIEDSKRLKAAAGGAHLERGVLACLRAASASPLTDTELFAALGCTPPAGTPWWEGTSAVPCCQDPASLDVASAMLRRGVEKAGIRVGAVRCLALDAPAINDLHARTGNKSAVSGTLLWRLAREAVEACAANGNRALRLAIDRQGGRWRYREEVTRNLPEGALTVEAESEVESRYVLRPRRGPLERIDVSFQSRAETAHLPVALASMTAKYVRELWMARLNRYFAQCAPGVAPTAGYVEDGRRFMAEVGPALEARGLDPGRLVRRG